MNTRIYFPDTWMPKDAIPAVLQFYHPMVQKVPPSSEEKFKYGVTWDYVAPDGSVRLFPRLFDELFLDSVAEAYRQAGFEIKGIDYTHGRIEAIVPESMFPKESRRVTAKAHL